MGPGQIIKNRINLDLIKIIQFCLKIYDLLRHPHLLVGVWVVGWMGGLICNGFKITFISEKHVGEDDIMFTNHLVGKWEVPVEVIECCHSAWAGCGSSWLWLAQPVLTSCST